MGRQERRLPARRASRILRREHGLEGRQRLLEELALLCMTRQGLLCLSQRQLQKLELPERSCVSTAQMVSHLPATKGPEYEGCAKHGRCVES